MEATLQYYLKALEILSVSTDDYLFLWDIATDTNYFFGDVDREFALRAPTANTNSLGELFSIVHPKDRDRVIKELHSIAANEKDTHDLDYRWVNRSGATVWVSCRGTVIKNDSGKNIFMMGRVSPSSLRSYYSPLTALANKEKLLSDLRNGSYDAKSASLMLLDVDRMASINLHHGREAGDALLKHTAGILEAEVGQDGIYHVEKDRFAVIFCDTDQGEIAAVYERIADAAKRSHTLSAGVIPLRNDIFIDENHLFDVARQTLMRAKALGPGSLLFLSEEELTSRLSALSLYAEMQENLKNGGKGFSLRYMPRLHGGNYRVFAAEALLGYRSGLRGDVAPEELWATLNETRLIVPVGYWMIQTALTQCKKWRRFLPDLRISVTLSEIQLREADAVERISDILRKTRMPPSALIVTIPESVRLREAHGIKRFVKQMKDMGIGVAIDDFGTGYSSISYLKELHPDEIRLDSSLIRRIDEDSYSYQHLKNIIDFGKSNGIRVSCKDVEEMREMTALERLSPDLMQGPLFDRPYSVADFYTYYINGDSEAYAERLKFVQKLYRHKERAHTMSVDPRDILRVNQVGIWVIRLGENGVTQELHADEIMEKVLGITEKCTPEECYQHWYSRIREDYLSYVQKKIERMLASENVVQLEYFWLHPTMGEVKVRCSGRRIEDSNGMLVLEGYHRIVSDIDET